MESDRLRSVLESLLFAADGPLSVERLRAAVGDVERREVALALKELQEEYETQRRGLRLVEVANGFQLRTPSEYAGYVRNLVPVKTARMSRANLETLAIVAYKQPITKAEIEDIRGVSVDGVVSTLLERRLLRIVARKDVPGKPFLYGTTKEFLEIFNLKDLSGLPTLKEMAEMTQALGEASAAGSGERTPGGAAYETGEDRVRAGGEAPEDGSSGAGPEAAEAAEAGNRVNEAAPGFDDAGEPAPGGAHEKENEG